MLLASASGCPDKQEYLEPCAQDVDCQAELVCVDGQCLQAGVSAGPGGGDTGEVSAASDSADEAGTSGQPTSTAGTADSSASGTATTGAAETEGDEPSLLLLKEDFPYAAGFLQWAETWSATGQEFTRVAQPSLTFPTYAPDDIGRHAFVPMTTEPPEGAIVSEELMRGFSGGKTVASSAVCYFAFLVNLGNSTGTKSVEVFGLWAEKGYSVPLVYARPSEIGYYLSLYPPGGDALSTKTPLKPNVTHLVVLKYVLDDSADERSLFVYNDADVPLSEPWVPLVELHNLPTDNIALPIPSAVAGIALRRGSDSHGTEIRLDAIRVATSWSGLFL